MAAVAKAPLPKGGWQKSLIFDWGIRMPRMRHIALWAIIPPTSLTLGHLSFALRAAYGGCAMYAPAGAAFRQGRLFVGAIHESPGFSIIRHA